MKKFGKALGIWNQQMDKITGGNTLAIVGAGVGGMLGGPMGASVGMSLGALGDGSNRQKKAQRDEEKAMRAFEKANRPQFQDPRSGLSAFSKNTGRGGSSMSMLMNQSSMFPSLLR
jgi:hypothetical protein